MASPRSLALALVLCVAACANGTQVVDSLQTGADRLVAGKSEATVLKVADATRAGGDNANAINLYRRAHELAPHDPVPLARLGATFAAERAYTEAIDAYKQAQALAPDDPDVARGLAGALLATDQPQLALSYLLPALKQHKDPRLYSLVGVADDLAGHYEAAQRSYAEGLSLSPDNVSLRNNLGLSQALAGNYAEAVKTLEAVAASPTATARTRQNLALAYGLAGETDKAAAVARRDLDEQSVKSNLVYYAMLRGLDQHDRAAAIIGAHAPAHGTNGEAAAMNVAAPASASEPQQALPTKAASAVPSTKAPVESVPLVTLPHAGTQAAAAEKPVAMAAPAVPAKLAHAEPLPLAPAPQEVKEADAAATVAAADPAAEPETATVAAKPADNAEPVKAAAAAAPSPDPTAAAVKPETDGIAAKAANNAEPMKAVAVDAPSPDPAAAAVNTETDSIAAKPAESTEPAKAVAVATATPAPMPSTDAAAAASPAKTAAPAPAKTRRYLVQVGAFHSPERAQKLCDTLAAKGFGLAVSTGRSDAGAQSWHFCRSASPLPKAEAVAMAQRLHDEANSATILVPVSASLAAD